MKKYLNTMNVCIGLVVLAAVYLVIAKSKKMWPFKETQTIVVSEKPKDLEFYRYANFKDNGEFVAKFKEAVRKMMKAPLAQKKQYLGEVKKVVDMFLQDNPTLKFAINTLVKLIQDQLKPIIESKLNGIILNATGKPSRQLIINACQSIRRGEAMRYLVDKVINPAFDMILKDEKLATGMKFLNTLGINIRSLLISVTEDLIKDKLDEAEKLVLPYVNTFAKKVNYPDDRIGDCSYDKDYARSQKAPELTLTADEALLETIEDFRYSY